MERCLHCEEGVYNFSEYKYSPILYETKNICCTKRSRNILIRILWTTFKLLVLLFLVIFVLVPLIFRCSYTLQQKALFLNYLNVPDQPLYDPKAFGLSETRNFYVYNNGIKLGVWHILPANMTVTDTNDSFYENSLSNGQNVVIYVHGNTGSRGSRHRVDLYKVLRQHFHVIAFDYRSYGDSTEASPNELDIVKDCMFMVKWTANRTKNNHKLFVWGHSLGTSLSTQAVRLLQEEDDVRPAGLVLESPFNNMRDEIGEFPLSRMFKNLPWFKFAIVDPMQANNFKFETDRHILNVDVAIIILHAKDDGVVPYKLGRKLYEHASRARKNYQGSIKMITFDGKFNYNHNFICKAPELPKIIESFIEDAKIKAYRKNLAR